SELVDSGVALTTFGPLFPWYLGHVICFLTGAIVVACSERRRTEDEIVRRQLTLIAGGVLATGGIGIFTNALLPYGFGEFRYCDIGTISSMAFASAIAYATFVHRLFDPKAVVRETLVHGLLLAFVLGAYSSAV